MLERDNFQRLLFWYMIDKRGRKSFQRDFCIAVKVLYAVEFLKSKTSGNIS